MNDSSPLAFDLIRWRIHRRHYSSIRAIMAELGESDTQLKIALAKLFDIHFDFKTDPEIFFTEDTGQREQMARDGVVNPTMLQLLLTAKVFALTEEECNARFEAAMKEGE